MTKQVKRRYNPLDNLICKHCGHNDHRRNIWNGVESICTQDECECSNCKSEEDVIPSHKNKN